MVPRIAGWTSMAPGRFAVVHALSATSWATVLTTAGHLLSAGARERLTFALGVPVVLVVGIGVGGAILLRRFRRGDRTRSTPEERTWREPMSRRWPARNAPTWRSSSTPSPPAEWDAPTLCTGWRVRDVVAHTISYDGLRPLALARRLAAGPTGANEAGVAELRDRTPCELVALVRERLTPRGLTAGFGGRIALTDGLIHHQDIRRPLGRPRAVPAGRLVTALEFARFAPPIGARSRIRGLTLLATDIGWRTGTGPAVAGPGEALLMVMAGRADAVTGLSGPGVDVLAARLGS
ncbi:maleylpyruvate isomerase family mycothiol-dependent enzyme [Pseudonocardia sp. HH130630-07]|uniref:maleylpyruvate isomerase family mycothiol-dependent enzyme n=1 Tax=Pseudonocardia sp. HH130630-07 TaxID=1690815 RepID=UPI0030010024